MQVKRTRLEIRDTEKRYYNNPDQTESGFNNFWIIFLVSFVILILIILFVTCYRYIFGQTVRIFKRCLARRNENKSDDSFPIIKETERCSCTKRRFLWSNGTKCNVSKFHTNHDHGERNKRYENKCKLKTLLQEKKKLLAPRENKPVTSTNDVDLTKKLSLKMSFSSAFSSAHTKYKGASKSISNKSNAKNCENYKCGGLSTQNIRDLCQNSYKTNKDISFSDTDLQFSVTPLLNKKSDTIEEELLSYKWNLANDINRSKRQNNPSSKLIELRFENTDSFSDNTRKGPTNSCSSSTISSISNAVKTTNDRTLNINSKTVNSSATNEAELIKSNGSKELIKSPRMISNELPATKTRQRAKSSIDVFKSQLKDGKNAARRSTSDGNFNRWSIKNDASETYTAEEAFVGKSEKLAFNNEGSLPPSDRKSEISETYDELGILFSQYIKMQTRPCQRRYCSLQRHLKRQPRHSTRKCQTKFHCCSGYSYDQRPMCNSGNICTDTYDEFKLMYTSPAERKGVYQCMFKRRKHFLNQPCIISN